MIIIFLTISILKQEKCQPWKKAYRIILEVVSVNINLE